VAMRLPTPEASEDVPNIVNMHNPEVYSYNDVRGCCKCMTVV
jgi:hypothetical protein